MSSWNRAAKIYAKPKINIPFYYDVSNSSDISILFLNVLGAYIYSQKQNEKCTLYDPLGFIPLSIKYNPQLKSLKEIPEGVDTLNQQSLISITNLMKFADIFKYAQDLFQYTPDFNRSIVQVLEKASIRAAFDIGIHISTDDLQYYADTIKEYQRKSKKPKLSIYVRADTYDIVSDFQKLCDPSWKLTSLSKFPADTGASMTFRDLAEVQIFAVLSAAILDFSNPLDKFIYLMQRNPKGFEFFREINGLSWTLF